MLIPTPPPLQAPAPTVPVALKLAPVDDRAKLNLADLGWEDEVQTFVAKVKVRPPASQGQGPPTFSLQPRIQRLPAGVFAFTTMGFLDIPGSRQGLRVFTATATRNASEVGPGIKQAALDATLSVLGRIQNLPPGAELQRVLVPGSPQVLLGKDVVSLDRLKTVLKPLHPALPERALRQGLQGSYRIAVQVDRDGVPIRADVLSGPPELSLLALDYAMAWRFQPPASQGMPETIRTEIPLRLDGDRGLPQLGLPPEHKDPLAYSKDVW